VRRLRTEFATRINDALFDRMLVDISVTNRVP
jgi:hypothetical protein